jgi:conjugal transfer pilus assembly protein TraW
MISRKLKNIDIEKHKEKMIETTKKRIEEPEAIFGVVKTIEKRSFTFDPTHTVKEDMLLPNGEILHKAGTQINPLDHMDFDRKMFFIDSRDQAQIDWLKRELNNSDSTKEKRVILVAGRPSDLSDELSMDVYFDQFGELTRKFGITQVPATVEQHESQKLLVVEEVKCDE